MRYRQTLALARARLLFARRELPISIRRSPLAPAHPAEDVVEAQYRGSRLASSFQPIIAVAQSRVAGLEALLRARDARGFNIAPIHLFEQAERFGEAQLLDQLAHQTHLARFAELSHQDRWLFLNCRPETLMAGKDGRSQLEITVAEYGYQPEEIVIEVLEQASYSHEAMTMAIAEHQANGFQVAIDDFGIGSSNFDRVWGVKPDFVKLDRSLIQRAALSRNDRRVAKMLVSMMHRMGVMVIAEGVETAEEALSIMDADVDFLQGFKFAMPSPEIDVAIEQSEKTLRDLWPHLFDLVHRVGDQEQAHIAAVRSMLLSAVRALVGGADLAKAGQLFFAAPNTLSLFLVDGKGYQIGSAQHRQPISPEVLNRIRPMVFDSGANWSRRGYFKDAIRKPGRPSIHGPHRSMVEGAFIYTTAITLELDHQLYVLCGNFRMDERDLNVPGIMTDNI